MCVCVGESQYVCVCVCVCECVNGVPKRVSVSMYIITSRRGVI